jgi:hypothetical protein
LRSDCGRGNCDTRRKNLISAFCNDRGKDTEPWPPHKGTQEHYIVKDEVWAAVGMKPGKVGNDMVMRGGGILCVNCIEKRLGRILTKDDFSPVVRRTHVYVRMHPAVIVPRWHQLQ